MNDPASRSAPLRVVVADDQATVREGLVVLLGLIDDIEVVGAAADGQEALDVVAQTRPDAILLDLRMPVLDGIETTRRLSEHHPDVAVVALTTYADDASIVDALEAGARSYLTKNADRADIAQGMTNPDIAAALYLSTHTVKTHVNRIFAKTHSPDRAAAMRYARDHQLG
ncbi:MAG: response regulator transcription factor [Frankia sp.]